MSIAQLQIHHLRNIDSLRLALHPRFNLIVGANGSGKTSILEAIYLLGTGHSFRTREISPLIHHQNETLTVFAKTQSQDNLSIQKSRSGPTLVRLNQQFCQSSSELAHFLPCQVVYQDIFQIIDAGSSVRRSLLDWGLFHVKPEYHPLWKNYRRALKQRNALLRQGAGLQQVLPWNALLAKLGGQLHELRAGYFANWSQQFKFFLSRLSGIHCELQYEKGWDKKNSGRDLNTVLEESFPQDRLRQTTQYGPHRADITFSIAAPGKARQLLSRGQQKMILVALKFAQSALLHKPCTFLLDDIAAELDDTHLKRLLDCLYDIKGQFFITSISPALKAFFSNTKDYSLFHLSVENKKVSRETD